MQMAVSPWVIGQALSNVPQNPTAIITHTGRGQRAETLSAAHLSAGSLQDKNKAR